MANAGLESEPGTVAKALSNSRITVFALSSALIVAGLGIKLTNASGPPLPSSPPFLGSL